MSAGVFVTAGAAESQAALAGFPSGVAAICAEVDGVPYGMISSSFSVGVSFEPVLAAFSVRDGSATWPILRRAERLGVSVLAAHHGELGYQLASRHGDRFAGLAVETTERGAIFLPDSPLRLDCRIASEVPAGDHTLVVLAVHALSADGEVEPLVYHRKRFRRLT